jgi:LuxR family maltose regulon positive regulatory protein
MIKDQPSIAKIIRPRLRDIFPRKRLFNLFDASRNLPLTWVTGPAGYGKTSLVTSYLDEMELPCIWYQVDEGDSDIASSFYYLGLAAKKATPRRRKPLPLLTPEYLLGIPTFTLRFFENLYDRLKPPFSLMFDNCHKVHPESQFHKVIHTAISAIPDGFNFIMISRKEPPPVYARLRANRQMGLIGWNDLRFSSAESRKMINLRAPEIKSKDMIDSLHAITDGWVAGLILVIEGIKQGIELLSLTKSTPEQIIDYFGSEVFNRTGKRFRTFLMQTAFLPKMTEKMVQDITGIPKAGEMLMTLRKNNYFIEMRALVEPVFQYHPLFRRFLILKAMNSFSSSVLADLHHRAALILEESGQFEEAAWLYSEEKNWESMAGLT